MLHFEMWSSPLPMRGFVGMVDPMGKDWPCHGSSVTSATNLYTNHFQKWLLSNMEF